MTGGQQPFCTVALKYPAVRCGVYLVSCPCGLNVTVSTAGRTDDPRTVKVPCKKRLQ